jgi:hypothetical protein
MPGQWLWVVLAPTLIGLVACGYIVKLEAGGVSAEIDPKVKEIPEVTKGPDAKIPRPQTHWTSARDAEKKENHDLFLAHLNTPSKRPGQKFDASIYLVRHLPNTDQPQKVGLADVKSAEFYFGASWNDKVFTVENSGNNVLGVRTSAYGTFLALCRVTFRDSSTDPVVISRYIDHEMQSGT